MIDFFINNINSLTIGSIKFTKDSCSILGAKFYEILSDVFTWIQISVPILVIVLCTVDMLSAVTSQDEKGMSAATSKSIKRLIIGVAIFMVPIILDVFLKIAGLSTGTCSLK